MATNTNVLALDMGDKRIGVALLRAEVAVPVPQAAILNDDNIWNSLQALISEFDVSKLVIGLPRNLSGESTAQTEKVTAFAELAKQKLGTEIVLQDEALTSRQAEEILKAQGRQYRAEDIDSMAASLILADYAREAMPG